MKELHVASKFFSFVGVALNIYINGVEQLL